MSHRLLKNHEEDSKMTGAEISAGVGLVTMLLSGFAWLKHQLDGVRDDCDEQVDAIKQDHSDLVKTLAKEYMDKDNTMQMYSLMNQTTEVRMTGVESAVQDLKNSNNDNFAKIYEKLDNLASR